MRVLVVMVSLLSVVISQKNLAPNGNASQSSVYYWKGEDKNMTAELAVTGGRTHDFLSVSCSTTQTHPKLYVAWWMLTFPVDTVYITNVLIYYRGNRCYKGWWDSSCSKPCPATCVSGHCYPGNGKCVWGCNPDNCLNDECDPAIGICTNGCKIGRRGDYCDKPCHSKKFGNNCAHTCHCIEQPCDPKTGACSDSGCQRGYTSFNCSIVCSHGDYGYNCNQSCDGCLSDSCDKEYGVCTDTSGCKPGWQHGQTKCNLPCEPGQFGYNCAEICHCLNEPCHPTTGECSAGGCERGYTSSNCSTECSSGYYGFNCEDQCNTCNSILCERFEGNCTYGCNEGFKGHQCLSPVTLQSDGQTTNDNTMNMVYTGVVTFIVTTLMCVIIFLVILRYRQGKICGDTKNQNEQNTRKYLNDAFTNDYANIGNNTTERHYEETIPSAQEHTYDTL